MRVALIRARLAILALGVFNPDHSTAGLAAPFFRAAMLAPALRPPDLFKLGFSRLRLSGVRVDFRLGNGLDPRADNIGRGRLLGGRHVGRRHRHRRVNRSICLLPLIIGDCR
jgi:hypothetical protein